MCLMMLRIFMHNTAGRIQMKRVFKILALLSGAALLALIGLGFWVRHRYPPERIRKMAAEMAGARLGRQVDIADAHLSLWGGVELKGIRISEARTFSAGTFIEIDRVRILPRLIPFMMSLQIKISNQSQNYAKSLKISIPTKFLLSGCPTLNI